MEAGAALYQRPDGFFLCVQNKNLTYHTWINEGKGFTGFSSASGVNVTCDLCCSDEELGACTQECLNRSR